MTATAAGAATRTYLQAIHDAQLEEMARDERVMIMGEDLRAGLFGTSTGFVERFGALRVRDTPLSENAMVGAAVGAAMTGLRPIVDLTMASFMYCAVDQLVSQAAKSRYMFGGQASLPLVVRSAMFYSGLQGAQHSDRPYPMLMGVPGLRIVTPASPADAKGLLKTAIRSEDPVVCFEDQSLWTLREEIPEGEHLVPFGVAARRRDGDDVTVVAIAGAVKHALVAAERLAAEGVSVEVLDPRTLNPLDVDGIVAAVVRTGRLVVAEPAHLTCGAGSEIVARVVAAGFDSLRSAPVRVAMPDVHVPFSPALSPLMQVNAEKIAAAVRAVTAR